MSRLRMTALALSLGLLAAQASADEGAWGTAPPAAAAQLGRPVAGPAPAAAAPALLDKPRPLGNGWAASAADGQVRPVDYTPVYRGQMSDAKPLPSGPAVSGDAGLMPRNWQRPSPDQTVAAAPVGPVMDGDAVGSDCGGSCAGGSCGRHPLRAMCSWIGDFCGLNEGCDGCDGFDGGVGKCGGDCGAGGACGGGMDGACGEGSGVFGCGGCCPPASRFYVSAEYLLWWTKGENLPPLITAGSAGDLAAGANVGALGLPGTTILYGNSQVDNQARSGARVMVGYWFGDERLLGIEGGGFFLGRQTSSYSAASNGTPILARPFFDASTGLQNSELVAAPGILTGAVSARTSNTFYGAEANLRTNLWRGQCWNVDLIGGYRYLALDEDLIIGESLQAVQAPVAFTLNDTFRVQNRFNGGQIGLESEWRRNRWSLDLKAKVAIGDVSEHVDIMGSTVTNGAFAGHGLLAQPTNSGSYQRNRFAVSPDVGINVGYQVTDHMRAFVGYDYLYLSDVVRAADQVDLRVNPNQLRGVAGGPALPAFNFHSSDYWAQGVSFGLEFRY